MSRFAYVTLVPVNRQQRDETVVVAGHERRAAVARERDVARSAVGRAEVDFPGGGHGFSLTVRIETVPSIRLATSASVPAGLNDTPDAPFPA